MRAWTLAALTLLAAPAAATAGPASRGFEVSGVIPTPPEKVWEALTTAEGWRRMGVPFAVIDFRIGGSIESNYSPSAKLGQPENIRNEIWPSSPAA